VEPGASQGERRSLSLEIYDFFENPFTPMAKAVQGVILGLIILSVVCAIIQYFYTDLFDKYETLFMSVEYTALGVFTVEFAAKLATASNKRRFATRPMTIVDILAIVPSYAAIILSVLINTSELRALRLLRLLWLARTLRIFKLLQVEFFRRIFLYNNTILQAVSPVIAVFVALKGLIWLLEHNGFWFPEMDLAELFAIIGFALGIVLSQKVTSTYQKFYEIEQSLVHLVASLSSLANMIDYIKSGAGTRATHEWARAFLHALKDPRGDTASMIVSNQQFYKALGQFEDQPADIAVTYAHLVDTATTCLAGKRLLTPRPYDSMLQQATVLYLFMLTLFLPGWGGDVVCSAGYVCSLWHV
jgi:hypothetical protein